MAWQREGETVCAEYHGQFVRGIVTESRVKYGGTVQHTVKLFNPITVFGSVRDTVLLDATEIFSDIA